MKTPVLIFAITLSLVSCNHGRRPLPAPTAAPEDSCEILPAATAAVPDTQPVAQPEVQPEPRAADPLVGSYDCKRVRESYVFYSDGTGQFFSSGQCTDFTWKRKGSNVTVHYELTGNQKLKFNAKARTIVEQSSMLGTLVYQGR
ncbi:MAG: hypothetical protein ILA34_00435 [Bacteroidaceae bacterium]|nr:hypothetical protein [Bacteroidaceae bacterium]